MRETVKENVLSELKDNSEHTVNDIQELLDNLTLKSKPLVKDIQFEDQKISNACEDDIENHEKQDSVVKINDEEIKGNENDNKTSNNNGAVAVSNNNDDDDAKSKDEDSDDENIKPEDQDEEHYENTDVEDLKTKFSTFELADKKESDEENEEKDEEEEEDEEESDDEEEDTTSYLKRGPMTEHRNQGYRFTPLQHASTHSHNSSLFNSPLHDSSSSFFDVVEFPQYSPSDCVSQGNGLNQSFLENVEGNCYNSCLSPESVHSSNSLSPFYSPNYSSSMTPNDYQFQSEISDSSPFSLDFGNKGFDSYQPLSPPKSVSPVLKDGQDSSENLKESEDLINIIDSVNKSYNTNADGIPESELVKLRSALEGNEDSIRNEMGMYLKNDHFQSQFNRSDDSSSDYAYNFEPPLTPPKSVSPVEENLSSESNSPFPEFQDCTDVAYPPQSDEHLIDILHGIDQINPEELNIYLNNETNAYDPTYARNIIHSRCKPNNLDHALRRLSTISAKYLCKKDSDGDTCLMIVYSKPEDSQDFYENIFCLQEKVREIRVCCDVPLGKAKRCKVCGNSDPHKFYTPLSLKNKQGDTALSCAVKTDHSQVIINYLLDAICQCPEDFRRVFDEKGKAMLADAAFKYPSLSQYV